LFSPMLTTVTIDIGVSTGRATGVERSCNIAAYLSALRSSSTPIQKLNIRGFACEKLNKAVCGLSVVKSLSLKVGTSLSTTTVIGIASFPFLEELFVHADRVDAGSLKESLTSSSSPSFPSLQILDIRSSVEVAATILEHTQSDSLTKFSVEVTRDDESAWTHLFSVIPITIRHIHIDHHIDIDEPIDDITDTVNNHPFTTKKLGALSKLTALRAFKLDTNVPINFIDKDVEELARWWPALKMFDLAVSPFGECKEGGDQEARMVPRITNLTVGCLYSIAEGWPGIERLKLPINLSVESRKLQDFPVHTHLYDFKIVPSLSVESRTPLIDANLAFIRNLFPFVLDDFSAPD